MVITHILPPSVGQGSWNTCPHQGVVTITDTVYSSGSYYWGPSVECFEAIWLGHRSQQQYL